MATETVTVPPQDQAFGLSEKTEAELQIPPPPTELEINQHKTQTKEVYQEILHARSRGRKENSPYSIKTTDIDSDEQTQATILVTDKRTNPEEGKIDPIFISVGWMTNGKEHSFETLVKNSRTKNSVGFLEAIPVIRTILDDLYISPEEAATYQTQDAQTEPVIEIEPEDTRGHA